MADHIIIFAHDFGAQPDGAGGLLPDIAAAFPGAQCIRPDLNSYDRNGILTVPSLGAQSLRLRRYIKQARLENPEAAIDLIGHSQGCITVAKLRQPHGFGLRRLVLLAPPSELSYPTMRKFFQSYPGSRISNAAVSVIRHSDGTVTQIKSSYWNDILHLNPIEYYNRISHVAGLTIIHAGSDEIIGSRNFSALEPHIKQIHLDADHNFTGPARPSVIAEVTQLLSP